ASPSEEREAAWVVPTLPSPAFSLLTPSPFLLHLYYQNASGFSRENGDLRLNALAQAISQARGCFIHTPSARAALPQRREAAKTITSRCPPSRSGCTGGQLFSSVRVSQGPEARRGVPLFSAWLDGYGARKRVSVCQFDQGLSTAGRAFVILP